MLTVQDRVDWVVNLLHDIITPLFVHNHSAISNLSSVLNSNSGGVPSNTDNDSMGSSITGSNSSLATLTINQLQEE